MLTSIEIKLAAKAVGAGLTGAYLQRTRLGEGGAEDGIRTHDPLLGKEVIHRSDSVSA